MGGHIEMNEADLTWLAEQFGNCIRAGCLVKNDLPYLNLTLEQERSIAERVDGLGAFGTDAFMKACDRLFAKRSIGETHICALPFLNRAIRSDIVLRKTDDAVALMNGLVDRLEPALHGKGEAKRGHLLRLVDQLFLEIGEHWECEPRHGKMKSDVADVNLLLTAVDLLSAAGEGAPMCAYLRAAALAEERQVPVKALMSLLQEHGATRIHDWNALMVNGTLNASNAALADEAELVRRLSREQLALLLGAWTPGKDGMNLGDFAKANLSSLHG